ncbi:MAG: SAM-dependent chlorinase/fluorinase [Gammaproteobacteria bacterium]
MITSRLLMVLAGVVLHASALAGIAAQVESISEEYGNVNTTVTWEQVLELGLEPGSTFTIRFGDKTFQVTLGTTYGDVERGEWIGLITDTGILRLARNFENAAQTLGCEVGDTITISAD